MGKLVKMVGMNNIPAIVFGSLFLVSACFAVWSLMKKKTAEGAAEKLQGELDIATYTNETYKAEIVEQGKEIALVKQRIKQEQQMLVEYEKRNELSQKSLKDAFHKMASDALGQSTEQFLHLAKKQFEVEKEDVGKRVELAKQESKNQQLLNQKAIESMVGPMGKQLEQYQRMVSEMEKHRKESYGSLNEQIGRMREEQSGLRSETANLVNALRRPEVRGRWGEMQLKRVAELAGMIEYCDFSEQVQLDGGRLRPDMVVNLPAGRQIVVDAKTPLDAYISAVESGEADEREGHYAHHVRQIESKVSELAKKDYQKQFERAPDFVILFIPGDSFLQAAVMRNPKLQEDAMARNVIIATPSTLVALLKAVAVGWREEKVADNARKISELGKELYKRLGTAVDHMTKMGSSLTRTVESYNKFVGSFDTKVMTQARRFDELGVEVVKPLPDEVPQIEVSARLVKTVSSEVMGVENGVAAEKKKIEEIEKVKKIEDKKITVEKEVDVKKEVAEEKVVVSPVVAAIIEEVKVEQGLGKLKDRSRVIGNGKGKLE